MTEHELINLLRAVQFDPDNRLKCQTLAEAMRRTDFSEYRRFRNYLADFIETRYHPSYDA